MGYNTDFTGQFCFTKPLKPEHEAYLRRFCTMHHIALDEEKLRAYPDPLREAVGLPLGKDCMYFTGIIDPENNGDDVLSRSFFDRDDMGAIAELCAPYDYYSLWPPSQPFSNGPWVLTPDGSGLMVNVDKPYGFLKWLRFLNEHFLLPWGYELSGKVLYMGEQGDHGSVVATNKEVHQIVDGRSLLTRPKEDPEKEVSIKVHWMTVGSISSAAREALLLAGCSISDLHEDPPIVLLGIPYDSNHYWRFGQDSLDIYTFEGIFIRAKDLCLAWGENREFPGKSWSGVPTTRLILPNEEYEEFGF